MAISWTGVSGEYPTNPMFIENPDSMVEPHSVSIWQQNDLINGGYPYIELFIDLEKLNIDLVRQREYITIYDMLSYKSDFLTNGLAILCPTSAVIHEVLNGEWTLTLKHPMDQLGKWQYIKESNIIKCKGQLFTIKRVEWDYQTKTTGTVTAFCEHIFYQLCDTWVFAEHATPIMLITCKQAMNYIMGRITTYDEGEMYRFDFDWDSEWVFTTPFTVACQGDGQTPVELMLGDGGIIDKKGGELYRNNFYFSINQRMENAEDDSFDIRIGANMQGVKRVVDASEIALWFRLVDTKTGFFIGVSYAGTTFPLFQFPHNVVRSSTITYPDQIYEAEWAGEINLAQMVFEDCDAIWRKTCAPTIYYDVNLIDQRNDEEYGAIFSQYHYKVGNTGRIYDDRLGGSITLKITETETDGITGEVTKVTFGSKNSFTRAAGYPAMVTVEPSEVEADIWLHDCNELKIIDSENRKVKRRVII